MGNKYKYEAHTIASVCVLYLAKQRSATKLSHTQRIQDVKYTLIAAVKKKIVFKMHTHLDCM